MGRGEQFPGPKEWGMKEGHGIHPLFLVEQVIAPQRGWGTWKQRSPGPGSHAAAVSGSPRMAHTLACPNCHGAGLEARWLQQRDRLQASCHSWEVWGAVTLPEPQEGLGDRQGWASLPVGVSWSQWGRVCCKYGSIKGMTSGTRREM